MRRSTHLGVLTCAALLLGCSGDPVSSDRPQLKAIGRSKDYADSATYVGAGNPTTGGPVAAGVGGVFQSNNTNWHVSGWATYKWVSDASLNITGSVIHNGDGKTLNSSSGGYATSGLFPSYAEIDTGVTLNVSTLNHTCSITGKSSGTYSAAINVTVPIPPAYNTYKTVTLWSNPTTPISGTDATLPDCKPPTAHFTMTDGADDEANDGGTLSLPDPQGVSFNASSSVAGDYPITGYSWEDGASDFSTSETASLYVEPGDYSISMTASDDYGDSASASGDVSVADTNDVYTGTGGPGGDENCWDVYIEYQDGSEQYWYSFCCDASGNCAAT